MKKIRTLVPAIILSVFIIFCSSVKAQQTQTDTSTLSIYKHAMEAVKILSNIDTHWNDSEQDKTKVSDDLRNHLMMIELYYNRTHDCGVSEPIKMFCNHVLKVNRNNYKFTKTDKETLEKKLKEIQENCNK